MNDCSINKKVRHGDDGCFCERNAVAGAVHYRKMFGKHMVYVDDKPLLLACDNTVFVKILPDLTSLPKSKKKGAIV